MTYRVAVIFLVLYFLRPQDWVPGMAGVNIIRPLMAIGILSLLLRTPRVTRRELFATPIDWLMLVYAGYLVYNSPDATEAIKQVIPYLAFYFVTTLSLTNFALIKKYLRWWLVCLAIIAVVGVATRVGVDVTGAAAQVSGMAGRLVLNTWLLNNPNALGHTVVVGIPMAYLLLWWKRPAGAKFVAVGIFVAAYYCAVFTESKGAYLVAAGGLLVALTFGRPLIVQGIVLTIALSIGVGGLMYLPRMSGISDLRSDEGVQGRLMAWEIARTSYEASATGEGWKQFHAVIVWEGERFPKATHSSFVKVAADLGPIGLFLYISMFCLAARALIQYKGTDEDAERCRRTVFLLLTMLFASGWMIDRAYHTEFFLIAALAAAYMRSSLAERKAAYSAPESADDTTEKAPDLLASPIPEWPSPQTATAGVSLPMASNYDIDLATSDAAAGSAGSASGPAMAAKGSLKNRPPKKKLWRIYSVFDFAIALIGLQVIDWLWIYILTTV